MNPLDSLEINGVFDISEIEYKGNFTINYKSKEQLKLLQSFFGVRRAKFDMELIEKRPEILEILEGFSYVKNANS